LFFGPNWSPDDTQLVYLDCQRVKDPAHFRADIAVESLMERDTV